MKKKNLDFFNSNSWVLLVVFYLVLLFLRVINGNFLLIDSTEYLEVAKYIMSGEYFSTSDEIISRRPFLYPFFLLFSISFNPCVIVFFQAILLFLTFRLFDKTVKFYGINWSFTVSFFVISTPAIFIYSQLVMSESLVLFLVTALFYVFVVDFNWNRIKYAQIILVLLAFTKPVFYPFVFVNFIVMLFYFYKVKRFNYWVLFPVFSILFYLNYNESKFGFKHFSSMENHNLIYYNLYYFKSNNESKETADKWIVEVQNRVENLDFKHKNLEYKKIADKEISTHFFSYSFYHFSTGIRGIVDPGRFDLMTFIDKEDGKQGFLEILNGNKSWKTLFEKPNSLIIYFLLIPVFVVLILKWFLFVRFYFSKKRNFQQYYFLILIGYCVLVNGPVNCSRYMMPLQLIIITFVLLSIKEHQSKYASQN